MKKAHRWIVIVYVLCDAMAFTLAWLCAWGVRYALSDTLSRALNPANIYWQSLPLIVIGCLIVVAMQRSYQLRRTYSPLSHAQQIVKSVFLSLLVVMSIGFLFKEFDFSRLLVVLFAAFSAIFLPLLRWFARKFENRLVKLGLLGVRVLIVGAGQTGIRALQKLQDHPEVGYRVIGFLDDDPQKQGQKIGRAPVLGTISTLSDWVKNAEIDEVIVAMPQLDSQALMPILMQLEQHGVRIKVVAHLFGVLSQQTSIDEIEDIPIYELGLGRASILYTIVKRTFDLVVGLVIFLPFVLTLPWIALLIKLDSRGPVFFKQARIGKGGQPFVIWKYRTMQIDSNPYAVSPDNRFDPRITRIGRFLRKTSIDELPQVLNVLIGNMSLVGPRPEMPFIVEKYNDWQRKRLEVTPGITGLWQILGRKDLPLHENLEYDFYYIKNRSMMLDIVILLKTIPAALWGRGAY